jgi:hypothetical protein
MPGKRITVISPLVVAVLRGPVVAAIAAAAAPGSFAALPEVPDHVVRVGVGRKNR